MNWSWKLKKKKDDHELHQYIFNTKGELNVYRYVHVRERRCEKAWDVGVRPMRAGRKVSWWGTRVRAELLEQNPWGGLGWIIRRRAIGSYIDATRSEIHAGASNFGMKRSSSGDGWIRKWQHLWLLILKKLFYSLYCMRRCYLGKIHLIKETFVFACVFLLHLF